MEIASEKRWHNIWLESDSLLVIHLLLKNSLRPPWLLQNRWLNCKLLISKMNFRTLFGKLMRFLMLWLTWGCFVLLFMGGPWLLLQLRDYYHMKLIVFLVIVSRSQLFWPFRIALYCWLCLHFLCCCCHSTTYCFLWCFLAASGWALLLLCCWGLLFLLVITAGIFFLVVFCCCCAALFPSSAGFAAGHWLLLVALLQPCSCLGFVCWSLVQWFVSICFFFQFCPEESSLFGLSSTLIFSFYYLLLLL